MKIMIVIDSLGTGGAEKSMVVYAKFLKKESHDVIFICRDKREVSYEEEVRKFGINIRFLQNKGLFSKVHELSTHIEEFKPEIIHSVLVSSNILVRLSRSFTKKGKVIQSLVNTPYSQERKKDSRLSWQKFLLAKQFDLWTARLYPSFYHSITETVLDHYRPIYRIKNNYQIIFRGRNENKNLKMDKGNHRFTLINVGRQEFAKGQIILLKALKYLETEYGITEIYLKILGFEGKCSKNLQDFVLKAELQDRVQIPGFVKNVEEELSKSSVFVFPSYYEGLGGALIEAFAAQLPCICSDLPVLREVVGDEKGALFCAPGDFKCLAEQILKLYNNKDLRDSLSQYSYSRFKKAFQLNAINKQMFGMYKRVLKA
ncbi:hypothetical protein C7S20_17435 [Christiangramia fulva]|uniref:Glycosyltransferase n=1 Tax=Christiangramia fulva TaxID=2126553 RepID=A0A2R3Z9H9_9FLAO|nr:glycosyltransferase [Christiangramia fulva]AVR46900.1 hypothetical protein C7S20_17435 [Christiangramia fulva]